MFRIQCGDYITCIFYRITSIEYTISSKSLFDYTNLFTPNGYENNGKVMNKYFKDKYGKRKRTH